MRKLLQIIISLIFLLAGLVGVLYAARIQLPWGPPESAGSGYLSPQSTSKQIILADGSCKNVISSTNIQYFIPTKTAGEINAFTGNLPSNVNIGSCTISCNWVVRVDIGLSCGNGPLVDFPGDNNDVATEFGTCTTSISGTLVSYRFDNEPCMASTNYLATSECQCHY